MPDHKNTITEQCFEMTSYLRPLIKRILTDVNKKRRVRARTLCGPTITS